jgi:hypothetical protein
MAVWLLGALLSCVITATPGFVEGAQMYCDVGFFSEVKVVASPEKGTFEVDFFLNEKGLARLQADRTKFTLGFAGIIEKMAGIGVKKTKVRYHFNDQVIVHCYPEHLKTRTTCESGEEKFHFSSNLGA